jgi:hypothetical protein
VVDSKGQSILFYAMEFSSQKVMKALIEELRNLDIEDLSG